MNQYLFVFRLSEGSNVKKFIRHCWEDASSRMSASQLLKNPWFEKVGCVCFILLILFSLKTYFVLCPIDGFGHSYVS